MSSVLKIARQIGPGILFASMAVGTSHLVLSTKAGATFGWVMIVPILLANVLKYPFFEYGVRYSEATGESLIEGYLKENRFYLGFYSVVTLLNAMSIPAVLYLITGELLGYLIGHDGRMVTLLLMGGVSGVLVVGRYRFLENSLKVLVAFLLAVLLYSALQVASTGPVYPEFTWKVPGWGTGTSGWLFLMSLVGWMPTAVETAAWVSMWRIEKKKDKSVPATFRGAMAEFGFGYLLTALLAVLFFFLGWWVLYGSPEVFELSGAAFSQQFARLFSSQLGSEFRVLIVLAAFATMLSSAMTAHDALSRVSVECASLLGKPFPDLLKSKLPGYAIVLIGLLNMGVILWFSTDMGTLITVATFISFVFAPLLGWLNLRTVTRSQVPKNRQPGRWNRIWAWTGIVVLGLWAIAYLASIILPILR